MRAGRVTHRLAAALVTLQQKRPLTWRSSPRFVMLPSQEGAAAASGAATAAVAGRATSERVAVALALASAAMRPNASCATCCRLSYTSGE